ncbi:nuclear transport factor 2 family protein [Dyadobacter luticola]|uniref:Nuclear transport factor 2 family protein n=1 Tax=Dyadobacter luticola TaxID=1979387 RepID=A0A5R9L407_9BACT|nr:nuclear transport factor 2 family protein [Dyadobacter luticola]TLV03322.1 nuclear transport factor 2 family protein [Dyadobacter luticola]
MTDQEQIAEAEERLMTAVKAGDVNVVEALLDEEVQFIDEEGKVIPHSHDLDKYRAGRLLINNIDVCDKQISLIGNTAMVLVIDRIKGKCQGRRFEGRYLYMRVWKRKDTCWKISAASCAAVPVVEF